MLPIISSNSFLEGYTLLLHWLLLKIILSVLCCYLVSMIINNDKFLLKHSRWPLLMWTCSAWTGICHEWPYWALKFIKLVTECLNTVVCLLSQLSDFLTVIYGGDRIRCFTINFFAQFQTFLSYFTRSFRYFTHSRKSWFKSP